MNLEQLGPYRTLRTIGQGGMGTVYAAENVDTGESVAIKVLSAGLVDEPHFRERFRAEIETLRKLSHPGIVQLYGFGEQDGALYYAMELIKGTSVQEELSAGRRFEWREVARMGSEICRALRHAHDHGVIHRDLKPANLLLDEAERVKLTDFGIAKLFGASNLTADGGVLGTADYMSPEQAEGRPVTHRCDLYSLGSVLYAMLAGYPPFAADTMAEVVHKLKFDRPAPIGRIATDIPQELQRVVMQLLEKDPQERIPTALAISHRLDAILEEMTVTPGKNDEEGALAEEGFVLSEMATADAPAAVVSQTATRDVGTERSGNVAATDDRASTDSSEEESRLSAVDKPSAPENRFIPVAPPQSQQTTSTHRKREGWPIWLQGVVTLLVLGTVGAIAWLAARPPAADDLYSEIASAVESGDIDRLLEVKGQIDQFLAIYPNDPRGGEVTMLKKEIELEQRLRDLERGGGRLGEEELRPVERAFLEADRLAQHNTAEAAVRLQALIDVYGNDADADAAVKRCVELARMRLDRLQRQMADHVDEQRTEIERQLQRAAELAATDTAAANRIRQGIVDLYGSHVWAIDLVERARVELKKASTD